MMPRAAARGVKRLASSRDAVAFGRPASVSASTCAAAVPLVIPHLRIPVATHSAFDRGR